MKPSILLYYTDLGEKAALERIRIEFQNRGLKADFERNLQKQADIGVYACGPNYFYDFHKHEWNTPNNQLSVFMLHDLYQDNGLGSDYFLVDPLHVFDLALFPSKVWLKRLNAASKISKVKPKIGSAIVGYPKSDQHFTSLKKSRTQADVKKDSRLKILVAASWQSRQIIRDLSILKDIPSFELSYKSPEWAGDYTEINVGPWREVLNAQFNESRHTDALASKTSWLRTLRDDTDIFQAIAEHDVIISNGSNVMFEAILCGKPAINISDWKHPKGNFGESSSEPHIDFPGILCGRSSELPDLISVANSEEFKKFVDSALQNLVDISTLGISAANTVSTVLETYFNPTEIVSLLSHEEVCFENSAVENTFTQVAQRQVLERLGDFRQNEPNQLTQERDQLTQERDQLTQERDQLTQERDQLTQERDQLTQERDQDKERLFAVLNSRTWKLFACYRRIRKALSK